MTCKLSEMEKEMQREVKKLSVNEKMMLLDFLISLKAEQEAEESKEARG